MKRDYDLRGTKVDLQAQTVDGVLVNGSDDTLASWSATVNIVEDCFINQAWVGTVEIHQYVGTDDEATQTLDLRDYKLEDVKLDHLYDGDLLIPLKKGDYIVYHPLPADEFDIAPRSELTMGMIVYFLDNLNLSDYTLSYRYHRDFTYGVGFIALVALAVLWVLLLIGWKVSEVSYKRAKRELDLRKSSLSSMSSIYSVISFIDLNTDELIPVYVHEQAKMVLPQGPGAKETLRDIFGQDTAAAYRTAVLEFVDTATLPERMDKDSIALDYVSKAFGWSQVRFFAVDREEGQPLGRVLCTIQDINDEKREREQIEQRAERSELEINARGMIISGTASAMKPSVQAIDDLVDKIMEESASEPVRAYAKQARNWSNVLTHLIDSTIDLSNFDDDGIRVESEEYSLSEVVAKACDVAESIAAGAVPEIEAEVSPSVPERIVGDRHRLERVLIGIFAFMAHLERVDGVKAAAYGTPREGRVHILFSAKASGSGVGEKMAREFANFTSSMQEHGAYAIDDDIRELEGVALMLMLMGSKLEMVNEPGEALELYFEFEQEAVPAAPADGGDDG